MTDDDIRAEIAKQIHDKFAFLAIKGNKSLDTPELE